MRQPEGSIAICESPIDCLTGKPRFLVDDEAELTSMTYDRRSPFPSIQAESAIRERRRGIEFALLQVFVHLRWERRAAYTVIKLKLLTLGRDEDPPVVVWMHADFMRILPGVASR